MVFNAAIETQYDVCQILTDLLGLMPIMHHDLCH